MARKNNKAYGTAKEREVIQMLLADGAIEVIRAGASRSHHAKGVEGNYDLIANYGNYSRWIQVKAGSKKYVMAEFRKWKRKIADCSVMLPALHYPLFIGWISRDSWYEFHGYDTDQELIKRKSV